MDPEEKDFPTEGPVDPNDASRRALSDSELADWEREDREDADRTLEIGERLAAQATRVVAIESRWQELAERAAEQAKQAGELQAELARQREVADRARAARRSASAGLSRAQRRLDAAEKKAAEAEQELQERIAEFEGRVTKERGAAVRHQKAAEKFEAEVERLQAERDELSAERDALSEEREALRSEHDIVRAEIERLQAERDELSAQREALRSEHDTVRAELAGLRTEHDAVRAELAGLRTEHESYHAQATTEKAALEDELRVAEETQGRLEGAVRESSRTIAEGEAALSAARDEFARLSARLDEAVDGRRQAEGARDAQLAERRALVADLVGAQATLQARSEQLERLFRSRWYRVARSAWRLRRGRLPLAAWVFILLAVAAPVAGVLVSGGEPIAVLAGFLAGAALLVFAVAYAVLVPSLRDRRVPRLAGDGTFARSLDPSAETAVADEVGAGIVTASASTVVDAEAPKIRLVPLPSGAMAAEQERRSWLGGEAVANLQGFRVAGILDEMSAAAFGPECDLDTDFSSRTWRERLEAHPPHMLLVESAWAGNGGGWQYCVGSYAHPTYQGLPFLRELIQWTSEQGIPTVFWNKEDPVHFDRFKEAAALFDHVFTTDANRIDAYRAEAGCDSVTALPFAAQPSIHNPIPLVEQRSREPVFAGTFYRDRHPDRQRNLEGILDAARPFGLVIYDRTYGSTSDSYGFPERFSPHIKGRLSYQETVDEYKRHAIFLNANSVTDSPTMFSRRVFELLACGTTVLSTPSTGMQSLFGDLVLVAEDEAKATAILPELLNDEGQRADRARRGQMLVLGEHTYKDRLVQIARTAGFDVPDGIGEGVAVVASASYSGDLDAVADQMAGQSRQPDEVVFGLPDDGRLDLEAENARARLSAPVRLVHQSAESWRELAALASTRWVAPLMPSRQLGQDHLRNLLTCSRFADAQVIGPADEGGKANTFDVAVAVDAAIADRELVSRRGWPSGPAEMRRWLAHGVRMYATDHALSV